MNELTQAHTSLLTCKYIPCFKFSTLLMEHALQFLSPISTIIKPIYSTTKSIKTNYPNSLRFRVRAVSVDEIPPNALRQKRDPNWAGGGFSLGIDLGMSRTGLAVSRDFVVRPLTVLQLRGQKLELRILDIAQQEEVDEFIIGLPKSSDGKETTQSNKVRSVAGRIAARAAERGWRVYLQNEHGTSADAMDRMLDMGLKKSTRHGNLDAYAAVMVLERYIACAGRGIELVIPKQLELQEKLRKGRQEEIDWF